MFIKLFMVQIQMDCVSDMVCNLLLYVYIIFLSIGMAVDVICGVHIAGGQLNDIISAYY